MSKLEPRKRPRTANRWFVYPAPNCCWQIDAFAWSLADGSSVSIHQVIDDHTRMAAANLVTDGETARAPVLVVSTAIRLWGVPQRLLSDNGLAFNPTRRGFTGKLVDRMLYLGVKPITGNPAGRQPRARASGSTRRCRSGSTPGHPRRRSRPCKHWSTSSTRL